MAATKVKTLDERKRDLIARSDLYRRAMADDLQYIQGSIGWVPKTFSLIRAVSPLLVMSGPLAAWLFRGKRKARLSKNGETEQNKASVFGRIWGAIRIAQQVVPFVHGFMQALPKSRKSQVRTSPPAESRHR